MTYDMRVREAVKFAPAVATNLGFAYIDDATIAFVKTNRPPGPSLGYRFGLYWPRQVYGRLVDELSAQHAKAMAFDVIFGELRDDQSPVQMADDSLMDSDKFFSLEMRHAGNVIIADTKEVTPPELFTTNALALGDITTDPNKDSDGVLRRAQAFRIRRIWHPLFRAVGDDPGYGVDLSLARVEPKQIVLPRSNGEEIKIPIDGDGNFDLVDFVGDKLPPGTPTKAKAFNDERIWHMGIILAAEELGLDLKNADVDLAHGKISLGGPGDLKKVIPVDNEGYFYIDWCLPPNDPRLTRESVEDLLLENAMRLRGQTNDLPDRWKGKLVTVGSSATGNDLTDRGATPLEKDTLLVSEHWNVANSVLTGRFIQRTSLEIDLLILAAMGIAAALLTWLLRALLAFLSVTLLAVGYIACANYLYVEHRLWLPIVLPVGIALLMTHVCLVTWRVVFEQADKRRVKSIFSTVVSPKIMNELLKAERLSLGGARREVTVMFADVRGFTEFTDQSQERAAAYVAAKNLSSTDAELYFDEQAKETLATINLYLGLVADTIIKYDATLDKFIGDCVMAFWGAPALNPRHASACVRAAVEAQRAIFELNRQREADNKKVELENQARTSAGLDPKPLLPLLLLGSGINTGIATVGIMGSETKAGVRQGNYTLFGREVNLASRLEGLSGRGRIFISETTYQRLQQQDDTLAAMCVMQPPAKVKGIGAEIRVYEVQWQNPMFANNPSAPPESGRQRSDAQTAS